MSEPQQTASEAATPTSSIPVSEPVALLRLPPDAGRDAVWRQPNVGQQHRLHNRTFYLDIDAADGQLVRVSAAVAAYRTGDEPIWRYAVGATIKRQSEPEPVPPDFGAYDIAFGDVQDEAQALALAEEAALAYLDHPKLPTPPAPIPNLDLVTPVQTGQTQMDFIKRRLGTLQELAENIHAEDFVLDEGMRATLARVADDMSYLIETAEENLAWGAEHAQELERLMAEIAAGEAYDGYHTHNELYEHRLLLLANLVQRWYAEGVPVVKSWRHHDGEACFGGGWFIVVMQLVTGQVSYHYPERDWELFRVPHQELAPVWDGHTPGDAAQRLREAVSLFPPNPRLMQRRCDNTDRHDPHYFTSSDVCWCSAHRPNLEQS